MSDPSSSSRPDAALDLAFALVSTSTTPLVMLDDALKVIVASLSFCEAFHLDPDVVVGRELFDLGDGEWNLRQLRALLDATATGGADVKAYEFDLERGQDDRRRVLINVRKLSYGEPAFARLVVSATDVTEARIAERLKDDLLREKAILLQELQHRVANSLQVIASVLLQSARKVQSQETRGYLKDAHNRVMSLATVQQQLAMSTADEVEIRGYLVQLCRSLGASMIHDPEQLSIDVRSDERRISAEICVSLGLIVTELVINALKHAFPDDRKGKVSVEFAGDALNWVLTVSDDGVGLPKSAPLAVAGLGTSIVQALATQLKAGFQLRDTASGVTIAITHSPQALNSARSAI